MKKCSLLLIFSLLISSSGQPLALAAEASSGNPATESAPDIQITAGDVLRITVYPAEEYSKEVTVQPDGRIEMPLIGAVLTKGLTVKELQDLLTKRFTPYVTNPKISINVRHFAGRRIAVLGEIRSPGYYEYRDGMKLLEVISLAGGLTHETNLKSVRVLRRTDTGLKSFSVNVKAAIYGDISNDVTLEAGDTIYLPRRNVDVAAQYAGQLILPIAVLTSTVLSIIILQRQVNHGY